MLVTYPDADEVEPAGLPLPQACGVHEGERSRGARDAHALAPRKGKPIRFHAVAEEDEGFGADDEAQLFILVQDAFGVLDAGIGGRPGLAHKPCE